MLLPRDLNDFTESWNRLFLEKVTSVKINETWLPINIFGQGIQKTLYAVTFSKNYRFQISAKLLVYNSCALEANERHTDRLIRYRYATDRICYKDFDQICCIDLLFTQPTMSRNMFSKSFVLFRYFDIFGICDVSPTTT